MKDLEWHYNQMGNSPGPVLGPGLGLQPYQSKKLTFIVKITKEGQKEGHYNQTGHHAECWIYWLDLELDNFEIDMVGDLDQNLVLDLGLDLELTEVWERQGPV